MFASAYDDFSAMSDETGLRCLDPSLTQQQFKDESDINVIVDRFMKTGVMPDSVSMPQYVDYEGVFDFQSAMNTIRAADENFMRMDAKVRSRFHNSPQEFLEFFANPDNVDEAVRLGLAVPPVKHKDVTSSTSESAKADGAASS
jgi:phage internal scaffolding protein